MNLPRDPQQWPYYWRELYEERVALMEFCGNMDRATAEELAQIDIQSKFCMQKATEN